MHPADRLEIVVSESDYVWMLDTWSEPKAWRLWAIATMFAPV